MTYGVFPKSLEGAHPECEWSWWKQVEHEHEAV